MNKEEKYGVGQRFMSNNFGEIEIVEKIDYNYRLIKFLDYNEFARMSINSISKGTIRIPSIKTLYSVGTVHKNKYGDEFEVIEILDNNRRLIRFIGYEELKNINVRDIKRGCIKNNFKPSICG